MNQKELTKTFIMILNSEKPFGLHFLYKKFQRFQKNPLVFIFYTKKFQGSNPLSAEFIF